MISKHQPHGVHLVGSCPRGYTTEQAFREAGAALGDRLKRLPDGECEPEKRHAFITFQRDLFPPEIWALGWNHPGRDYYDEDLESILAGLSDIKTGYDDFAISSYATFCNLRQEGTIPQGVRFQVSLPSPVAVMLMIDRAFRAMLEPIYRRSLLRALERIVANITHHDLAIQWDVAADVAFIEGEEFFGRPWFPHPTLTGTVKRLAGLIDAVAPDVEVGMHFCYGDIDHKHFKDPEDLAVVTDLAIAVTQEAKRPLNFVHLQVPKHRDDAAYFKPWERFESVRGDTEVYLGLVHPDDPEGTLRRIEAASTVMENFGVAGECGFGRSQTAEAESIMAIAAAVSVPNARDS